YRLIWKPAFPHLAQLETGRPPAGGSIRHTFCRRLLIDGQDRPTSRGGMTAELMVDDPRWLVLSLTGQPGWAVYLRTGQIKQFDRDVFEAQVKAINADALTATLLGRPTCPHCGAPVPGLLASCRRLECLRRNLDHDAEQERRIEAAE